MLKHYLKVALRHLKRQQMITLINIAGLSIAMACCILIVLFIRSEYSYDDFHRNGKNIYRVNSIFYRDGQGHEMSGTQAAAAPALKAELPAITSVVRVMVPNKTLMSYGDKRILENRSYADADFFKMFSFPLIAGDVNTVLKDPNTVVVSEKVARNFFGSTDVVGKMFRVENKFDYQVSGVMKDMPENTDLACDVIFSMRSYLDQYKSEGADLETEWMNFIGSYTYVQLADATNLTAFNKQLHAFSDRHVKKIANDLGQDFYFNLQPLSHIHLHPEGDSTKPDNSQLIYIYMAIALFIILIAAFNFMNLITARANERAVEVGLRKVMGSERRGLILQFLSEAVLLSLFAFVLSIIFALLAMPLFELVTNKTLTIFSVQNIPFLLELLLLAVGVGLLSGSYPAFYLSGFLPVVVMKGGFQSSGTRAIIRKSLVIAQFAIAIVLVSATIVVYSQLRYWQTKYLGFDKEGLVNIYLPWDDNGRKESHLLKEQLLRLPEVKSATASSIGLGSFVNNVNPVAKEGDSNDKSITTNIIIGDFDLAKTYGLRIIQGRDFSPQMATDSNSTFIVNEAMVKALQLQHPLGSRIEWRPGFTTRKGEIVGVVKDFNYASLANPVSPAIYIVNADQGGVLTVRLNPGGDLHKTMGKLENLWKSISPNEPFQSSFVSDDLAKQYTGEDRLATLFASFSILAIIIACMGLFGLSILISRQRTKEIGIRKVLGASTANITRLLSFDFMKLVMIAILFALPISWFLMHRWLQDFAFRIDLQWWMFVSAGVAAMGIALLTISFQSVKAALMNPVRSLRTE
jgi:putative ABC transport system permease protein